MTRRAIKGGLVFADYAPYFIGEPLTRRVNTNWGISMCKDPEVAAAYKMCSALNGGYPGDEDDEPYPRNISLVLKELNMDPTREGEHTFAIYSVLDSDKIFSRDTQHFPTMDDYIKFDGPQYNHCGCRDYTGETQYNLVTYHSFFPPTDNKSLIEKFLNQK